MWFKKKKNSGGGVEGGMGGTAVSMKRPKE